MEFSTLFFHLQSFSEQVREEEARPVQCAHQGTGHHAAGQHPQDGQVYHPTEEHRLPAQAQRLQHCHTK